MQEQNPLHINISHSNEANQTYNQFKEYLIINHLELQKDNQSLQNQIGHLKILIQEKETEEDKYDTRTRYFRSLLTNLNELKNGYFLIISQKDDIIRIFNTHLQSFYSVCSNYYVKLVSLNILYIIEHIIFQYFKITPTVIALYIIINSIVVYSMGYNYLALHHIIHSHKTQKIPSIEKINCIINEKKKDLSKLDESTLSLENWVYEV